MVDVGVGKGQRLKQVGVPLTGCTLVIYEKKIIYENTKLTLVSHSYKSMTILFKSSKWLKTPISLFYGRFLETNC